MLRARNGDLREPGEKWRWRPRSDFRRFDIFLTHFLRPTYLTAAQFDKCGAMGDNFKVAPTATDERYLPLGTLELRLPLRGSKEWTPATEDFRDALRRAVARFDVEDAAAAELMKGTPRKRGRTKEVTEGDVVRGLNWLMGDRDTMLRVEWRREGDDLEVDGEMAVDAEQLDSGTADEDAGVEPVKPPIPPALDADHSNGPPPEEGPLVSQVEDLEVDACSDSDLSTPPDSPLLSPKHRPPELPPPTPSSSAPPAPALPPAPATPQIIPDPAPPPSPPRLYSCRVRISLLSADYGWRISQRRTAALHAIFSVLRRGWDEGDGPVLEVSVSLASAFLFIVL